MLAKNRSELIRTAVEQMLTEMDKKRFEQELAAAYIANAQMSLEIMKEFIHVIVRDSDDREGLSRNGRRDLARSSGRPRTRQNASVRSCSKRRREPLRIDHDHRAPHGAEQLKAPSPIYVSVKMGDGGTTKDSCILCDQIRVVDQSRFGRVYGALAPETMASVDAALIISLGLAEATFKGSS